MLYISAEALSPKGTDQVISTTATALKVLPIAARHPAQLYLAGSLALLGLGGQAIVIAAIAALVRSRGSALATVAALIGGLGAFCGAISNVLVYPNLARRGDGTPDTRPAASGFGEYRDQVVASFAGRDTPRRSRPPRAPATTRPKRGWPMSRRPPWS